MAKIHLVKRVKYAGDVHAELLKAGWDLEAATLFVENIPDADVAPVEHAKWIDGADSFGAKRGQYRVCSRCNICIPCVSELAAPYWRGCPNCLARMDGGGNG